MNAVLKDLKVVAADVSSAYVQALAGELFFTIVVKGYGSWQGKRLIIVKEIYGLKSYGAMWNQEFSDNLRYLGFLPFYTDFDL